MRNSTSIHPVPPVRANSGYVLMVSIVLVLALGIMGFGMIEMSQRQKQRLNALKERVKYFYASDGILNLLTQEAVNGRMEKYMKWDSLCVGGHWKNKTTCAGTFSAGSDSSFSLTSKACMVGEACDGNTCKLSYLYTKITGKLWEVRVRIDTLSGTPTSNVQAKVYFMAREDTTMASKFFAETSGNPSPDPTEDGNGTEVRYKDVTGGTEARSGINQLSPIPIWLSIRRDGNTFYGRYSRDGYSWQTDGERVIAMKDTLFLGIASSQAHFVCTDCPSPYKEFPETSMRVKFGKMGKLSGMQFPLASGDVKAYYSLEPLGGEMYKLYVDAYKLNSEGDKIYSSPLDMVFEPRGQQILQTTTIVFPIIVYDYKSDCTNSNFQHCKDGNGANNVMIEDALSPDHKPVFKADYTTTNNKDDPFQDNCKIRWPFPATRCSDKINEYFRISGSGGPDNAYKFWSNPTSGKWEWVLKSDNTATYAHYKGRASQYVGINHDSTYEMANVFWEDRIYLQYDPVTAMYKMINDSLIRTDAKGWGKRGFLGTPLSGNGTYAWETHIEFTYNGRENLTINNIGDDLWVFINGHFATGVNSPVDPASWRNVSVNFDDLASKCNIQRGRKYLLEIFHTRRFAGPDSDGIGFYMTTNVNVNLATTRRTWKRDFGNLN